MKWSTGKKLAIGLVFSLFVLLFVGVLSYKNLFELIKNSRLETKTYMILKKLEIVLTCITDAETGQRGYIITGDKHYLEPYYAAIANIDKEIKELRKLIMDNPNQQRRLDAIEPLIAEKLNGLEQRIALRKNKGFEAAAQEVRTGKGRIVMDKIRKIITEMENEERNLLKQRAAEAETSAKRTIFIILFGSSLAFVIVSIASLITHNELKERKLAEEALQKAYTELEQKVEERTAELQKINASLQGEIAERQRTEEELRENEESYRELANSIADVFFEMDKNLRYTYWNRASENLTGISAKDAIGRSLYELFPEVKGTRFVEVYLEVLRTQKPKSFMNEYRLGGKDFFFEISAYPSKHGLSVFVKDITEHKKSEEMLRQTRNYLENLLNYANAPIIVWDPIFRITRFNHAFEHLTGYTAEEVIGRELFILFPEESRDDSLKKIESTLSGEYWESVEIPILRKDGEIRIALWNSANIYTEDGKTLLATIAQGQDITERKNVVEKLRTYQEQLRSLTSQLSLIEEQERRRIATDLHDHIGQTLALCKIKLGTLQELFPSTDYAESMNEIRNLIEQTIQYTRSLTFELSPAILYELGFEAAVEWIGEQILSGHGIKFEFENDSQPKPLADESRILLFQAVREVLINVAKHARADNAKISIRRDNGEIRINVEDNGIGFDTSKINSFLRDIKGFGFFSIRERLNYIGGHIEVESEPGQGTRVTLIAPLERKTRLK